MAIETRATFIRTFDGRRVIIPNKQIYSDPLKVASAFEHRRTHYDIGIGYGDDIREARDIILETMKGTDGVVADPAPAVVLEAPPDKYLSLPQKRRGQRVAFKATHCLAVEANTTRRGLELGRLCTPCGL